MPGINTGKVITGGLLAGLVFNALDFLNNTLFLAQDFAANSTRLGLDPATLDGPAVIGTFVVVDFVLGLLVVFNYAAMRPRFGPGPRTAIIAGLVPYVAVTAILFGFSKLGLIAMPTYLKASVFSLITVLIGSVVGAWAYKES
jgi:hypothetical protein